MVFFSTTTPTLWQPHVLYSVYYTRCSNNEPILDCRNQNTYARSSPFSFLFASLFLDFGRKQETDGWDDAPTNNNGKRNFSSQADEWDDEQPNTKRKSYGKMYSRSRGIH